MKKMDTAVFFKKKKKKKKMDTAHSALGHPKLNLKDTLEMY